MEAVVSIIVLSVLCITGTLYFACRLGHFLKCSDLHIRELCIERREREVNEAEKRMEKHWNEYSKTKLSLSRMQRELSGADQRIMELEGEGINKKSPLNTAS